MKLRIGYNFYVRHIVLDARGIMIIGRHFMFATGQYVHSI